MENSMEVPQKTKPRVTMWSSNPIPGHIFRQNYNSKRSVHPCVDNSTIHNSWNKLMSTDRWMDKENVVHIYSGMLLRHKKQNTAICSSVDGMIILSEISQKKKGKYHMISLICGIHHMTQMNFTKQKWIHRHREATWGCQGGKQGRHEVWVWD